MNRKGEYFKCCDNCRVKGADYRREHLKPWDCEIKCGHCGDRTTKNCKSIHKRRFGCQTFGMNPRPDFEEWLKEQDYDKLLWEYKKVLEDILQKRRTRRTTCSANTTITLHTVTDWEDCNKTVFKIMKKSKSK